MSSLDGNYDSETLSRIDEEVESHLIILGQPVQPVQPVQPDARPQSRSDMTEIMKKVLKVLSHSEVRHMSDNFMPHELVRQILMILENFNFSGDPTWPLRQMRDWFLTYIRALRHRYPGMDIDEITRLAKQIVYEAFRRFVEGNTPRKLRKFTWLVTQCELIEADDTPEYFRPRCSLFLPQGSITIQALRAGWGTWENFNLLRQRASIEAMCEMQTILSLSTPATENTIALNLRTYQHMSRLLYELMRLRLLGRRLKLKLQLTRLLWLRLLRLRRFLRRRLLSRRLLRHKLFVQPQKFEHKGVEL